MAKESYQNVTILGILVTSFFVSGENKLYLHDLYKHFYISARLIQEALIIINVPIGNERPQGYALDSRGTSRSGVA
jgi:hypothetical protein